MRIPTVMFVPTVTGPYVGELVGQRVEVDGKTTQTRPVPLNAAAWAEGTACAVRKRAAARIIGNIRNSRLFLTRRLIRLLFILQITLYVGPGYTIDGYLTYRDTLSIRGNR